MSAQRDTLTIQTRCNMSDRTTGTSTEGAEFRGARRVQGYFEDEDRDHRTGAGEASNVTGGVVPQTGDNTPNGLYGSDSTAEQMLAAFAPAADQNSTQHAAGPDGGEEAPTVEPQIPAAIEPGFAEARLRGRERGAETPSLGFRGMLRKMGFRMEPSEAERHAAQLGSARSLIRLSSWPRSVGVLVANPKGGVGKTPLSLALGGTFAHVRGGGTMLLEVADDPGALAVRAEGPAGAGIGELIRDIARIDSAGQLNGYVAQQTSYAAVIGTKTDRDALTGDDVRRLAALTDTYYPVRVMDSGNQPSSSAFHGALDVTDVLVIPINDALDALHGAMQLLRHLHQLGGRAAELARAAIVVRMDDGRPKDAEVVAYANELIENAGIRSVYEVSYDPHIAERTTLTLGTLQPSTSDAVTLLAAAVVQQLNNVARKAD